jgi:hypothetical protein
VGKEGLITVPHERAIDANAGDEPSVVVKKVLTGKGNYGYNAASIVGLMLTTGCMIQSGIRHSLVIK